MLSFSSGLVGQLGVLCLLLQTASTLRLGEEKQQRQRQRRSRFDVDADNARKKSLRSEKDRLHKADNNLSSEIEEDTSFWSRIAQEVSMSFSYGEETTTTATEGGGGIAPPRDVCPDQVPDNDSKCIGIRVCTYGEEFCCDECSPSIECACIDGIYECFRTEFCLQPPCETTSSSEFTTSSTTCTSSTSTVTDNGPPVPPRDAYRCTRDVNAVITPEQCNVLTNCGVNGYDPSMCSDDEFCIEASECEVSGPPEVFKYHREAYPWKEIVLCKTRCDGLCY